MTEQGALRVTATAYDWLAPWEKDCAEVSAFYFTSQWQYLLAKPTQTPNKKPLAERAGLGAVRRNTLLYTPEWGSCVVLTTERVEGEDENAECAAKNPLPRCGTCRRCLDACPTGALPGYGIEREKCLRHHMLSGEIVPEPYRKRMGVRLLGCEICQRVCPHNAHVPVVPCPPETQRVFALDKLLSGDVTGVAARIGANYARRERVVSQACIAAGNTGDARYLPALTALTAHPRPAIAEHARWAIQTISKE